jgi:hypothetical protein
VTGKAGIFSRVADKAPYFSSGLLVALGVFFIARGIATL